VIYIFLTYILIVFLPLLVEEHSPAYPKDPTWEEEFLS